MKDILAMAGEIAIPSVAKFLAKAKELSIHEMTELNQ